MTIHIITTDTIEEATSVLDRMHIGWSTGLAVGFTIGDTVTPPTAPDPDPAPDRDRTGHRWSDWERNYLRRKTAIGVSIADISKRLHRSTDSVRNARRRLQEADAL